MREQLYAGAAHVVIPIPENFFPYASFMGRYFTGIHDELFVRCLLLKTGEKTVLVINMDLADFGHIREWKARVRTLIDVPEDNIFFVVTHNHLSPHVCDDRDQSVEDVEKTAQYGQCVWQSISEAICQAQRSMCSARVCYGTGTCDINVNREYLYKGRYMIGRNPHGPSDKTVVVVKFEDMQGKPIAFFINYAVHGSVMMDVTIKDGGMFVSGDLPGYTSRYIEECYSGQVTALWTSGAAGNQDPKYIAMRHVFDADGNLFDLSSGDAGYELVAAQAEDLAQEVMWVISRMGTGTSEGMLTSIQHDFCVTGLVHPAKKFPKPPIPERIGTNKGKRIESHLMDFPLEESRFGYVRPEDGEPLNFHLSFLSFGETALIGVPGEATYELGKIAQRGLSGRFKNVVVVTHCNGSLGYMADETGFDRRVRSAQMTRVSRGWADKILGKAPAALLDGRDLDV